MEPAKMTNGVDPRLNERRAEAIGMFLLGLILGVLALFRAEEWFDLARQTEAKGIFIIPLTQLIVFARGWLVVLVAALYFVFAIGTFLQRRWHGTRFVFGDHHHRCCTHSHSVGIDWHRRNRLEYHVSAFDLFFALGERSPYV